MKVVHVLTRLLRAGSEENTLATCRGQIAAGHEVHLYHGRDFDDRYYKNPIQGLKLVSIESLVHPVSLGNDVRAVRHMTALLKALKPEVVHTHQSKAGILGRIAASAAGVPVVIHGVHIVPFENVSHWQRIIYLCAEKFAARLTDAFINVSRGTRDLYVSAGIGPADRHHIVHSGFDMRRFKGAQPPVDWREILRIGPSDEKPPVIVMLAALEPRKRHCEFLDVFHRVVEKFPEVRLVMPGEGPHRFAIEVKIKQLGLEKNALLVGYRQDPERLIAMADVCTLTSTREGLPRVIMQYLAVGKPCVVTDLPGLDEVVTDGVNGVVVSPDGMAQAADALSSLLGNPETLHRLTEGAKAIDLSSWDVDNMCRRIDETYAAYLSAAGVAA
jgi:glycosyltransferase involved in cell wall biosynthesis